MEGETGDRQNHTFDGNIYWSFNFCVIFITFLQRPY